jgi:hypothetical protein
MEQMKAWFCYLAGRAFSAIVAWSELIAGNVSRRVAE